MREIKFRAFDMRTKKMSPEFVLFGEFTLLGAVHAWQHAEEVAAGLRWDMTDNHDSLMRLNDLEVMQFTGLLDKNGKEIYEGDILHIGGYVKWYNHIVVFVDGCFRCSSEKDDCYMTNHLPISLNCEVIGNVHENPELLNQGV